MRNLSVILCSLFLALAVVFSLDTDRAEADDKGRILQFGCTVSWTGPYDVMFKTLHDHVGYGGLVTSNDTTAQDLLSGPTTCEKGYARSTYWHPKFFYFKNGVLTELKPYKVSVYYFARGPIEDIKPAVTGQNFFTNDFDVRCGGENSEPRTLLNGCTKEEMRIRGHFDSCTKNGSLNANDVVQVRSDGCPTGYTHVPNIRVSVHFKNPVAKMGEVRVSSGDDMVEDFSFTHFNAVSAFRDNTELIRCVTDKDGIVPEFCQPG